MQIEGHMSREEVEQVVHMLSNMGFKVEWVDQASGKFLISTQPVRAV